MGKKEDFDEELFIIEKNEGVFADYIERRRGGISQIYYLVPRLTFEGKSNKKCHYGGSYSKSDIVSINLSKHVKWGKFDLLEFSGTYFHEVVHLFFPDGYDPFLEENRVKDMEWILKKEGFLGERLRLK